MNRGEKALVTLKGRFAYGLDPPPEYQLDKMADVYFTIFLKGYEKVNFYKVDILYLLKIDIL